MHKNRALIRSWRWRKVIWYWVQGTKFISSVAEVELEKPRYFRRVHTGYEWNEYDHQSPPPKQVRGYKFDVYYPGIVGTGTKKATPTYKIEKDGESHGRCIIRFSAGKQYQELAIRIINEE
ncbi:hypothetical protein RJ640_005223 [Escallonia rubra]|uniref:Splicing factor Cactin C-terminal domain-containing protein n=1 Tax=Escallonia rubra TaxID=112253 RepID=A0AA88QL55_9ASTE|nr:hypothetical protein RJ640_005223 [Escallonia rubra]